MRLRDLLKKRGNPRTNVLIGPPFALWEAAPKKQRPGAFLPEDLLGVAGDKFVGKRCSSSP
jgi:hypothetical protein